MQKNKIKLLIVSMFALFGIGVMVPVTTSALVLPAQEIQKGVNDVGGTGEQTLGQRVQTIVNILLYILGAIAVVMIVIGGVKYTTSNGDASNIKSAKETILYSVIGLVVAILAYAIVNFVLQSFIK